MMGRVRYLWIACREGTGSGKGFIIGKRKKDGMQRQG